MTKGLHLPINFLCLPFHNCVNSFFCFEHANKKGDTVL